jgi:DNA-binding beta-propeller fold protein YncE
MENDMPRRLGPLLAVLLLAATLPARAEFVTFESGQVRPLALSPDGTRLFAVNTPDDQLEIFTVSASGLTHTGSVPVGLEPVAVAARTDAEVWVVNHLSDSISIVDVASSPPRVVRTLLVGDEPRDLVFAATGTRAFVTTAHRGQNRPGDPQLTTPGVGRADVWVFDVGALGAPLGGTPLTIVTLFADTPRALAVSPDGNTVYAAAFHSGNRTTSLHDELVCDGGAAAGPCSVGGSLMPGGLPAPNVDADGVYQPEVGLIVKFDEQSGEWNDELGRDWSNAVRFTLPDHDVFAIDATANPPVETASFAGVGTVLFNMAVNPVTGRVYVSNTEARNEVRFEGSGNAGTTVRGHLHESRITVLDGATVTPRHLNKHIDYATVPSPAGTAERSLATPTGMAVTQNGATLYVAAFSSQKVGIFDTAALEADTFTPSAADHVTLTAGGPSGLVLDEARGRLYVFTRFDNAVSVIDTTAKLEVAHLPVHNPEPVPVFAGRPILYDAMLSSSNGEASCASCHVFGDFDSLAWDLGNPDDRVVIDPNPRRVADPLGISFTNFHPLKGPMTTQSLRGMANHGPMHWRGDRTGGNDIGGSSLDENAAFLKFIGAFDSLLGRDGPISDLDMQRFADFMLQVTYPPNPVRALDNSLTPDEAAGRAKFFSPGVSDVFQNCNGCHRVAPEQGFFGTDGFSSFEFEVQFMKIPHLRNLYQKVGMFGMPSVPFFNPGDNGATGPQVRGFGFLHDGSTDTLFRFHHSIVFNRDNPGGFGFPVPNPDGFPPGAPGDVQRRQVEHFMLAMDSNLAPIVGQQVTRDAASNGAAGPRLDLLMARAAAGDCDVVVKGVLDGVARGWLRTAAGTFQPDRIAEATLSDAALRSQGSAAGQARTYTCVPPGSGERIGLDRDEDGFYDRDEIDAGFDPANPNSHPDPVEPATFVPVPTTTLELKDPNAARRVVRFVANTKKAAVHVTPPARGSSADPTVAGATLIVHNSGGLTPDVVTIALPATGWIALGSAAKPRGFRFRGKNLPLGITTVVVKSDKLLVKGGGPAFGYTLDEPQQGRIAVRLGLGDAPAWCADAPARTQGNPPSTAKSDHPGRFRAAQKTPAPAACPPLPSVGSPSGAFLW